MQQPQHQKAAHHSHSSTPSVSPAHQQDHPERVQNGAAHGEDVNCGVQSPPQQYLSLTAGEQGNSTSPFAAPATMADVQSRPEQQNAPFSVDTAPQRHTATVSPLALPAFTAVQASQSLPSPSTEPHAQHMQDASNCSFEPQPCISKPQVDSADPDPSLPPHPEVARPAPSAERMPGSPAGMRPASAPPDPGGAPIQQEGSAPHAAGKTNAFLMLLSSGGQTASPDQTAKATKQESNKPHATGNGRKDAFSMLLSSVGRTGAAASPKPTGSSGYADLPPFHVVTCWHHMLVWQVGQQAVCRLQPEADHPTVFSHVERTFWQPSRCITGLENITKTLAKFAFRNLRFSSCAGWLADVPASMIQM